MSGTVRFMALGGVGEIGMNNLVLTVGDRWWLVDCGVTFPGEWDRFAEIVLPDLDWIRARRDSFAGIVLTHGHEDHIGAVPFVLKECRVPVYGNGFTLALVRRKLDEHGLLGSTELRRIEPADGGLGEPVRPPETPEIGFTLLRVTHSIPQACALAIDTPAGTLLHTGDFRIEDDPMDGIEFDAAGFRALGDRGVRLMFSDSTNALVPGRTASERSVTEEMGRLIGEWPGRVLVSTFSSNLHRLRGIQEVAHRHGRQVCLLGRSLHGYADAADVAGIANLDRDALVDARALDRFPREKLVVIMTGSQGERRAALYKAANGAHPALAIDGDDLVLLSSRIIPGNERHIYGMINDLRRRGATVINPKAAPIHTSGHARRDELAQMIELVRPEYFVPVHGEYDFLLSHRDLAVETGIPFENTLVMEDGEELELGPDGLSRVRTHALDVYYLDGSVVADPDLLAHNERRKMFYNGTVTALIELRKGNGGKLEPAVELQSRGVFTGDGEHLDAAADAVADAVAALRGEATDEDIEEVVATEIRRYFRRTVGKKPTVVAFVSRS